jgi:hypothetical protein
LWLGKLDLLRISLINLFIVVLCRMENQRFAIK